jgi:2-C-methyl-D-erythritol 4-phosphate cytidylyltransferase
VNVAVIVAGGSGERFGEAGGKQLAPVAGLPVLAHTLRAFEACGTVDAIVVVTHPARVEEYRRDAVVAIGAAKVTAVVGGGSTRRASVAEGLRALPAGATLVAVHDGARAAITPGTIAAAFAALAGASGVDGVVVGHPSFDTVKRVGANGAVEETPDRDNLWIAQTPQVFRAEALLSAHARAAAEGFEGTDDASLVERNGGVVSMVPGPRWNMKVTVPEDLDVLAALLAARARQEER